MGFAVIHIEKGTAGKAGGLGRHIDRTANVLNADPAKKDLNFSVRLDTQKNRLVKTRAAKNDLQSRINERIKDGYKGKKALRKDAVTHLSVVLTGSHEDMTEIAKDKTKFNDWVTDNYRFVGERFGFNNVVEFAIHMDERTPHIHCVVVPLTADGRLSAKEVMGDRRKMTELQESYGAAMEEKHGLKRGVKGSTATHDSVREYYARIEQHKAEPPLMRINVTAEPPQIDTPPLISRDKWTETQNKAICATFDGFVKDCLSRLKKQAQSAKEYYQTANMVAEEKLRKLRQENSQLKGEVKQLHKQLNPQQKSQEQKRSRGI